jgi:hypothetical protein
MVECIFMYGRPVETILRMREGRIKENDGGSKFNCYIISTFINVSVYLQYSNNMII